MGLILFAAFLAILAGSCYGSSLELNYVEQIRFQNGYLYYVDRGDDNCFRIIRSDTGGDRGDVIICFRHVRERYRRIQQLFFDDEGNAYVLVEETDAESGKETTCRIFRCNFKQGKLEETEYDFSDLCQQNGVVSIQCMRRDGIYYFGIADTETAQGRVRLCVLDPQGKSRELDTFLLDEPYLKAEFFLNSQDVLLWMDHCGEVFAKELGNSKYLNIEGITGVKDTFKSLSNDGEWAYVLDYESDCIREIDLSEQISRVLYTGDELREKDEEFDFAGLLNPDCTQAGFCAGVRGEGENSVVSICSYEYGVHRDLENITLSAGSIVRRMRNLYAGILAAAVLLGVYWYVYCRYQVQTILVRLLLVFLLGLFVVDERMENWLGQTIREQLERDQTMSLAILGNQLKRHIAEYVEMHPGELPSEEQTLILNRGMQEETEPEAEGGTVQGQEPAVYVYSILEADSEGRLRVRESVSEYSNVPAEWYCSQASLDALYLAYESEKGVNIVEENERGRRNSRFIPIILSDGSVYGVLEINASGNILDYQIWYYQWHLRILSFSLILILTSILFLILIIFLRPLKKLKECAGKLAAGEMGLTVSVHGHDEVANIASAFNQMSLGIARYIQDIQEMSAGYYKFIPARILELLGKDSIQQVKLGDGMMEYMTILSMHAIDYPKQKLAFSAETVYTKLNQILSVLVDPITNHHGVVEHFEDTGLSAFFTESSQEALEAAIEIHRALDSQVPGEGRSIAISYGQVMIGVIGHENRMEAAAISIHADLAKALRLVGDKYGARILVTHLVCRQIPDFEEQYHARYLGNIYLSAGDTLERLYDVYDGDTEEEFYYKELTRPLFEQGVELFVAKKFYEARLVFVEVLKQHRRDKAAKEYLYRCDRYYKLAKEDTETVIEKF